MNVLLLGGTSTLADSSSSAGAAGTVGAIAFFAVLIFIISMYYRWIRKGLRPRTMTTSLTGDQLRTLFAQKVANLGWKVIDNDNPLIAQSPLIAGIRQQITCTMTKAGNGIRCDIRPTRVVKKWGNRPTKAHTLRMRLNAFENAVNSAPAPCIAPRPTPPGTPPARAAAKAKSAVPPPTIEALPISLPPPPSRKQVAIHFGGEPSKPAATSVSAAPAPAPATPAPALPMPMPVATPQSTSSTYQHSSRSMHPNPLSSSPMPSWLTPSPSPAPAAPGQSSSNRAPFSPPARPPVQAKPAHFAAPFAAPPVFAAPPTNPGDKAIAAVAADDGDHDGQTMTAAQLAVFRAERAALNRQVRLLTGDLGGVYEIDGPSLIGRNPSPRPGEAAARLIAVRDPSQTLSKTHAALGVDDDGLWVEDRGSSNGTVISTPDGASIEVSANRVSVVDGATLYFGDRAFVVSRPA